MNVEDRLKAALQGTAKLVEDRPRPLPAAPRRQGLPRFMPAWAALVVALVVLGPFVLPDGEPDAPIPMSSPSLAIGTAPEVYVAVYGATENRKSRFEIRSTATGELRQINEAGNGESFVSIAAIPDDGGKEGNSFYLLTRLGAGTQPRCTQYTVYRIQISTDGNFSSWGTNSITFEALDGTPANLATNSKGDQIAYSYEGCGRKVREGGIETHIGDGLSGEQRIAHHWAGTTTSWYADKLVRNLAYSPDGRTLAAFLQSRDAKDGGAPSAQLRFTNVGNPHSGFTDERENEIALGADNGFGLVNAMFSPDGKRIVALRSESRQFVREYKVTGLPLPRAGGGPRSLGSLKLSVDHPANLHVLMEQHPSSEALLFQVGDTTFLHIGQQSHIIAIGEAPSDLAW
ncbi:hypothetical protein [Actinocorallia populi]|uniref:hypothetical protein n=1 Tax=Actinocorallia populi TaxID=2079200 RepID=UPI000D088BD3|nr:hypothetical protein [Actinocorallia populi]